MNLFTKQVISGRPVRCWSVPDDESLNPNAYQHL